MTEEEWLDAIDALAMLRWLRERASERKLRLFGVGCCRQIDHFFYPPRYQTALHIAEQYADGMATENELANAHRGCDENGKYESDYVLYYTQLAALQLTKHRGLEIFDIIRDTPAFAAAKGVSIEVCDAVCSIAAKTAGEAAGRASTKAVQAIQVALIRDQFGNPFRPVVCDPSWRTATAVALADAIYAGRAFDRLPILADALEEAGCADPAVLSHCRGDGPHARGCWVVDMVLGKS